VGDDFPRRFPTVFAAAVAAGFDPRREPLPVTPAAHYHMGGIEVDPRGRSSLPGLWACGEAASTGAHGANRLASNSLLEALVFGARVADDLKGRLAGLPGTGAAALARLRVAGREHEPSVKVEADVNRSVKGESGRAMTVSAAGPPTSPEEPAEPASRRAGLDLRERLQKLMWWRVGLLRDGVGLAAALDELAALGADVDAAMADAEPHGSRADLVQLHETRNLLTAGRLAAAAALARRESRGAHHREDFPAEDPAQRHRLRAWLDAAGRPQVGDPIPVGEREPVGDRDSARALPFADLFASSAEPAGSAPGGRR
jgi:L-aspartate oxidase